MLPQSYQYQNLSEGADRVGGQLRGDKQCPFSGVTKSGTFWRKEPESDARSVISHHRSPGRERARRTQKKKEHTKTFFERTAKGPRHAARQSNTCNCFKERAAETSAGRVERIWALPSA